MRSRRLKLGIHVDSGHAYRVYRNQAAAAYLLLYFFIFLSLQCSTLKFFITLFSVTVRPRRLKLGTHVDSGQMNLVYRNQATAAYLSLYFFMFTFSPIIKYKKISSHFSQELWGLEDWNLVLTWIVGTCIVYTGIRLLLLICYFISSFFFLSNFQTKFFVTLFSRTVRPRRLKLGTHVDSGQMYRVYRNHCCLFVPSFLHFLSLQFSNIKLFRHTFIRNCKAWKVETWYTRGQWVDLWCIPESGCCCLFVPIFFIFSFSNIQVLKFSSHFLRNCEA